MNIEDAVWVPDTEWDGNGIQSWYSGTLVTRDLRDRGLWMIEVRSPRTLNKGGMVTQPRRPLGSTRLERGACHRCGGAAFPIKTRWRLCRGAGTACGMMSGVAEWANERRPALRSSSGMCC